MCRGYTMGSGLLLAAVVLVTAWVPSKADTKPQTESWADKWCELNDCYGVKERERMGSVRERIEKEERNAARRYKATGEIRAIKTDGVKGAFFEYNGPVIDHPAFPGIANELVEKEERKHEAFAVQARKEAAARSLSPPQPGGGYLLPNTDAVKALAVRSEEDAGAIVARRRHSKMKDETRMGCMYEYNREKDGHGGFRFTKYTTYPSIPKGCAAGSVWLDNGSGKVALASRTAESLASVWRKVNGTEREWFEDVLPAPKGVPWVQSLKEQQAEKLKPYKAGAPPPCAPGYGGAFCKKELGTGADYVDEEDQPPPWANMQDVLRLKAFWKEQYALSVGMRIEGVDLTRHDAINSLPLAPHEFTAGTAKKRKSKEDEENVCACEPNDAMCISKCTKNAMVMPKKCYEKCDNVGCHEECVHVELVHESATSLPPPPAGTSEGSTQTEVRAKTVGSITSAPQSQNATAPRMNECTPGEYSSTGLKPCSPCSPGTFSSSPGARSCVRCPQGSWSNATGASGCSPCGEGGSTKGTGATSAKDCGAFAQVTGLQAIEFERKRDDTIIIDGRTGDESWRPTVDGGASGPWYGGWWMAVYGKNLGKAQEDLQGISVGDVDCKKSVWLSESSCACMVPRGMGRGVPVTVDLKKGAVTVESKFSYEAPLIESYHPRHGHGRGGFWVTITGKNFGHVDTKPTVYLAGRICMETYWQSDKKIITRGPIGSGGSSMLHTIDVVFEPTDHVQEMPRRLRSWVRTVLASSTYSVPQQPKGGDSGGKKAQLLIDLTGAKTNAGSSGMSSGLVAVTPGGTLEVRQQQWKEKEDAVKAEFAAVKEAKANMELASLSTYLEGVEQRMAEVERLEDEERERRLKELRDRQALEEKIRAEDEAALEARRKEEEARRASSGAKQDKLDKFKKAAKVKESKKAAVEVAAMSEEVHSCTKLVHLDCGNDGHCTLDTKKALQSASCQQALLERFANVSAVAGMEGDEAAKKVTALLYERKNAIERAANLSHTAQQLMEDSTPKNETAKSINVKMASSHVKSARKLLENAGVLSADPVLASVEKIVREEEEKIRLKHEAEEREREKDRQLHRARGDAAVQSAEEHLHNGRDAEARASHGSAVVEYQLAGAAEEKKEILAKILERVVEKEKETAERVEREAREALLEEERRKAEEERVKREKEEEERAKKAAEEAEASKRAEAAAAAQLVQEEEDRRRKAEMEEMAAAKEAEERAEREKRKREEDEHKVLEGEGIDEVVDEKEKARREKERIEAARFEQQRAEKERIAREKAEKKEAAKAEEERQRLDKERIVKEKAEQEEKGRAAKAEHDKRREEQDRLEQAQADGQRQRVKGTIGLGVRPVTQNGAQIGLQVSRLVEGGPASRSEIRIGDMLTQVDGVDVHDMPLKQLAAERLAGSAGDDVSLKFTSSAGEAYTIVLKREALP